jgi:hypothetical protein
MWSFPFVVENRCASSPLHPAQLIWDFFGMMQGTPTKWVIIRLSDCSYPGADTPSTQHLADEGAKLLTQVHDEAAVDIWPHQWVFQIWVHTREDHAHGQSSF